MSEAVQAIVDGQVTPPPAAPAPTEGGKESPLEEAHPQSGQPNKDEKISSRLEMLIRREQQALARERIAKAAEQESARLRSELESERERISKFNSIKNNPKLALEELGLTYDELTKAILSDGELPPEVELKKIRGEIDNLKQSREEERKQAQAAEVARAEAMEAKAVSDFKVEINSYVKENPDRYELINFDERFDEVYELIDAHYARTLQESIRELESKGEDTSQAQGKVMKIAEAADKIEAYYEKREQEKRKLAKLQTIWGAVPKESLMKAVNEARGQESKKPSSPKTLTNNLSATHQSPRPRPKTDDERVAEALANWRATRSR